MRYTFTLDDTPGAPERTYLWRQLELFNLQFTVPDNHRFLTLTARDEAGEIAGGLVGDTYWDWLHIDILWVREDARRHGLGKALMAQAEAEAIRRGCRHAHVDTLDFQAPDFYPRLGYTVWGTLEDLPPGHRRIFFQKDLV